MFSRKEGLIVVGFIATVLFYVFVVNTSVVLMTPGVFAGNGTNSTNGTNSCTDTDGGLNYYLDGTVSGILNGNYFEKKDYCVGGLLNEYYCSGNSWILQNVTCPSGYVCDNAACRLNNVTGGGGNNSTNSTNQTHAACVNNMCTLVNGAGSNTCSPVGSSCGNSTGNSTNQTNTCSDSDGGLNYYLRGTATGLQNGVPFSWTDYCYGGGNSNLVEFGCVGNLLNPVNYHCPNGCLNGACQNNQTNQTVRCYTNGDCGIATTMYYCNANGSACSSVNAYQCRNAGTVGSWCETNTVSGCSVCQNGCVNGQCLSGNSTNQTASHAECVFNTCTLVSGAGKNQCDPVGGNCVTPPSSHNACVNGTCRVVSGPGSNQCTALNSSCGIDYHYECTLNRTCARVAGPGSNACANNLDCRSLTANVPSAKAGLLKSPEQCSGFFGWVRSLFGMC